MVVEKFQLRYKEETRRVGLWFSRELRLSDPVLRKEQENSFLMAHASWWIATGSKHLHKRDCNFHT